MEQLCAYAEATDGEVRCLSLESHLVRTAYLAYKLFGERVMVGSGPLGYLNRAIRTPGQRASVMILTLAALLHDIGKASAAYTLPAGSGYASYPLHEHVSAHLVDLQALDAYGSGGGDCALSLHLTAAVIARHHSAMYCRHPDDLDRGECRWSRSRLREAVSGATRDRIAMALPGGLKGLLEELGMVRGGDQRRIGDTIQLTQSRWIINYMGRHMPQPGGARPGNWLLPSIQVLTGALIVSDILVAWRERCSSGECKEPDKAYARSWISELEARQLLEKTVREPLEELIEPVRGVLEEWREACSG